MKKQLLFTILLGTIAFASISVGASPNSVADSEIDLSGFDTIAFIMIAILGVVIIFGLIYIFIDAIKEVAPGISKFLKW